MFLHISDAKYLDAYRIEVTFSDGRTGVVDLVESLDGPVFEALRDQTVFSRFTVDDQLNTIVWSNGADMAPEYFYFQAFKDEVELQPLFKKWGYLA
ncbi:MAG TPA: DUF2442 domain-containing protein [Spongiibacteraceae bacterium]|nr:DUF2442 domain-containing protein [Spongiibacteraceae bacterium]